MAAQAEKHERIAFGLITLAYMLGAFVILTVISLATDKCGPFATYAVAHSEYCLAQLDAPDSADNLPRLRP